MVLKKICPKCGKLIDYTKKYCENCNVIKPDRKEYHKKYDKTVRKGKDEKYTKFYHSKEWEKARKIRLVLDNGLCQECLKKKKITVADVVHHKKEIKTTEGWKERLNIEGLESLCHKCHTIKHKKLKQM